MAVPIYVWNGTAWESTGPTIPANPIKYQASAPSSPSTGDIWVDSDADVTTQLVDLIQWEAFPDQILDTADVQLYSSRIYYFW